MVLALAGCGGDGERPSGGGGMTGAAPAPGPAAGLAPAPGAGSAPGTPPSPVPTTQPTAEPEIAPSLDRLRVVYIGGSITEGAFSTVSEKSYASLLTAWLATHYRTVDARNFGFGGTGSDFAAYRIDHDLAGFAPDLAFLEFSVNDAGKSRAQIYAYLDAIVTKLRQTNPHVKVVYISTTDVGEEPDRRAGRRAAFVENSVAPPPSSTSPSSTHRPGSGRKCSRACPPPHTWRTPSTRATRGTSSTSKACATAWPR